MPRHPSNLFVLVLAAVLALASAGCETPPGPFVPKVAVAPEVVYCNDHTGHKPGSKPFVMGGTCCCTPTPELMAKLQADGFCTGMTADDLREEYAKAGIQLTGPGHEHCNGLCEAGPHVVLGGKCMCPPTPGTEYAERVICAPPPGAAAPTPQVQK
jgi:hypothetical protein